MIFDQFKAHGYFQGLIAVPSKIVSKKLGFSSKLLVFKSLTSILSVRWHFNKISCTNDGMQKAASINNITKLLLQNMKVIR